jgi:pyrroline-5-carboxylate reductase
VTTLGIIGTGNLAGFLVAGLERAGRPYDIVLSPRNAGKAAILARYYGAAVARSNQEVVELASIVVTSVLPQQAEAALAPLRFRDEQIVISVLAAVSHERVAALAQPARAAVAMMPGHANALGMGPSCLYPTEPRARALLEYLGPVFAFDDARHFAAAAAFGAFSGMTYGWMAHVAQWFERKGLQPSTARQLVACTLRGNAEVLLTPKEDFGQIIQGIAPPGGITELGNRTLSEAGGHSGWDLALDAVSRRINGKG